MRQHDSSQLPDPENLNAAAALVRQVLGQLDSAMLGRADLHRMVLAGIFSRGHILLEGLPGLGKTAMIHTLGQVLKLTFRRVQFTPDLMPGDILGTSILQEREDGRREMHFEPGPVFTNILLADEINRASPKTQSALLEAMQERSVTTLGQTRQLPDPFFVLASQNPIELEGTYPLPEAQLDRFLFKLHVGPLAAGVVEQIITTRRRGEIAPVVWSMSAEQIRQIFAAIETIILPQAVARYIARLTAASHPGATEAVEAVNSYVIYGASPRAAIAMAEASRAYAFFDGRPTVGFEDVKAVAPAAMNHRLILNYQARCDKVDSFAVVDQMLEKLDETGLRLPEDVKLSA